MRAQYQRTNTAQHRECYAADDTTSGHFMGQSLFEVLTFRRCMDNIINLAAPRDPYTQYSIDMPVYIFDKGNAYT